MIAALVIGREGSTGYKGKNTKEVLGRPLMSYAILAALNSTFVDKVFLSTDSERMGKIGRELGAEIIERPKELAANKSLSEDAFQHGYFEIKKKYGKLEFFMPLFANAATITPGIIDKGITQLRKDKTLDSAVTVSLYNMWSPLRARKIIDGLVKPFVPPTFFEGANCDRDSQGDTYFIDGSASVVRPICMEDFSYGEPPFKWVGKNVYPLVQWGGLDIDYEWQVPQVEFWLKNHGFTETVTPYDK